MENKIAIVCSEFNKELVESLKAQACKEYNSQADKVLAKSGRKFEADKALPEKARKALNEMDLSKSDRQSQVDIGFAKWSLQSYWVPGSAEIPLAVKWLVEDKKAQAVLALGVIIRGKTTHYDFLCDLLQKALWDLQKTYSLPILFSVLMVENRQQAEERIKKLRGAEVMNSLLKMIQLKRSFEK